MAREARDVPLESSDETVSVLVPDDQVVSEGGTPSATEGNEQTEQRRERGAEGVGTEQKGADDLEAYSEGVKKRIAKLTGKLREAERRERAALEYAQAAKREYEEMHRRSETVDNSF